MKKTVNTGMQQKLNGSGLFHQNAIGMMAIPCEICSKHVLNKQQCNKQHI